MDSERKVLFERLKMFEVVGIVWLDCLRKYEKCLNMFVFLEIKGKRFGKGYLLVKWGLNYLN